MNWLQTWRDYRERKRIAREYRAKHVWECMRFQGGGRLTTPKPMSEEEAIAWLGRNNNEVAHVDRQYHFIFYRPRGA